jgi:hypothetical protein
MIPVCKDWLNIIKNPPVENKSSNKSQVPDTHLSASVQIMQFVQLLQGFAVPLILTRLYVELSFATVITQYRICMALLSSVGTLALSEWSSINQGELNDFEQNRSHIIQMVYQLLKKYSLLLGTVIVLLPFLGTCFWNFLSSKLPNPPLISWLFWGLVIIFYQSFTILSIVETSLSRYRDVLYMNSIQVLSCISLFYLPVLQSESTYPLNLAFSYLMAICGILVIKK